MPCCRRPASVSRRLTRALRIGGLVWISASWAAAQSGAPILAMPNFANGGATGEYLSIWLADGSGHVVDRLERDPTSLRSRPLAENLFRVIGREADQAAQVGEVFLAPIVGSDGAVRAALYVETALGYAAYFENPGRGARLGDVVTLTTRPFEDIASRDGNYALLMRNDATGRTEGAYLYHATTGRAVYLDGLRKLEISPETRGTPELPKLAGRVTAAQVHTGSEGTGFFVVLDPASGGIHFFHPDRGVPHQVRTRAADVGLYDVFSREGTHTSGRRFLAVPVDSRRSRTDHVLILDAVTGETAVLENVTDRVRLTKGASLASRFASDGGERVFSAVPRVSSGATAGVWVIDSQTRRTVYVDRPGLPSAMTVSPVTISGR
jgi:hypothetical protein